MLLSGVAIVSRKRKQPLAGSKVLDNYANCGLGGLFLLIGLIIGNGELA